MSEYDEINIPDDETMDRLMASEGRAMERIGCYGLLGKYATMPREYIARDYMGYWKDGSPVMKERTIPAGSRVRINMHSRFGDVGITTNFKNPFGYETRVDPSELIEISDNS